MKFRLIIDKEREEEVIIVAKERTPFVCEIESLVQRSNDCLMGFKSDELVRIDKNDIFCFTIEKGKLLAITDKEKLQIKQRLYQIEDSLGPNFIKINQSSIANIEKIDRFKATLGGSLIVIFKNGYRDYVSRRQARTVKERLGVK